MVAIVSLCTISKLLDTVVSHYVPYLCDSVPQGLLQSKTNPGPMFLHSSCHLIGGGGGCVSK